VGDGDKLEIEMWRESGSKWVILREMWWEMGAGGRWGHVGDGDEEGEWEQVGVIERDVEEDGSTWEMEREMGCGEQVGDGDTWEMWSRWEKGAEKGRNQ
jgi:hypothetical protein